MKHEPLPQHHPSEMELLGDDRVVSNKSPGWTYVLEDAALPEGHMRAVYPLGVNILIARVSGKVYAVSGKCAHMACPLFTGRLAGFAVICPCHDWRFDIRTGRFLDAPELGLTVYPVKLEADKLFINVTA